ncbi:TolB family protein [Aspergillus stella-maris]|uniref:TolB family protein n=1 Tax=Aspergillus stella-maris TaxID=1810926 RepID=UPI003CCD55DB
MRSQTFSLAGFLACAAPALAACPYASQLDLDARSDAANPHNEDHPSYHTSRATVEAGKKGVFFMNRIAPGTSELYIADADGSNERPLLSDPVFEYHATFSPDGQWITFTGERNGDGNSDIYRVRPDGSDLQELLATSSMEDSVVLNPNGTLAAYVSTENGYRTNVWVMDIKTGERWNVTDTPSISASADHDLMNGYFRPSWSPDGQWITFSSDRNTNWRGHGDPTYLGISGWEHTQELSIYAVRPDASGFRQVVTKDGYSLGSPKWSTDGKRIIYYEMTREATWGAHRPESIDSTSSDIISVDFKTGKDRKVEVSGSGVKSFPQYINKNGTVGFHLKGTSAEGIYTTSGTYLNTTIRSPAWSPDGKYIVYEKTEWDIRPMNKKLYSWDDDWEYQFTDVFPQMSNQGRMVMTEKQLGNSSIVTLNPDGSDEHAAYDNSKSTLVESSLVSQGLAGAFQPSWSPDGEWLVFGEGAWFQSRATTGGWLVRATANGSDYEVLTSSNQTITNTSIINSGFPTFNHNGTKIVYRVWGANSTSGDKSQLGLRVMDLATRNITVLTTEWDNLPFFSPDGEKIVFTRKTGVYNYDVCTIKPDGTDLKVLTSSGANDAHAIWSYDGRIIFSTGMFGFQYECALYDDTFQPYGQVMVMDADGSNKQVLTDSIWEDSMPLFVPADEY